MSASAASARLVRKGMAPTALPAARPAAVDFRNLRLEVELFIDAFSVRVVIHSYRVALRP